MCGAAALKRTGGNPAVRNFRRGTWKRSHGSAYTGTKLETADTAKSRPNECCACSLLYLSAACQAVLNGGIR